MNLAVVGSRDWPDQLMVSNTLLYVEENISEDFDIISGGARGVDSYAASFAKILGHTLVEHLPDWDRYGRSAGFLRNELIIADADLVLAFQHNKSRGTQHTIDLANKAGIPVIVFES